MRNALFSTAFVLLTCAAISAASAQQPGSGATAPSAAVPAAGSPTSDDINALTDARIAAVKLTSDARLAALKAGLKLRPDQEKSWSTFESTVRDLAKQRQDRLQQLAAQNTAAKPDAIAFLRQRADLMSQMSADLKKYADALDPLYKSLDDGQKRRMVLLVAATR